MSGTADELFGGFTRGAQSLLTHTGHEYQVSRDGVGERNNVG
jgi:hypothetical protein